MAGPWSCVPTGPLAEANAEATWGVAAVIETDDGPRFVTVGTSFAVDSTRLVTNAHVIDAVLELALQFDPSVKFAVVQHETGTYFLIERMWKHPDFDPERFLSTPDLGVISVAGVLPTVVTLANDFRLRGLSVLDNVALCGFPGDVSLDVGSSRPRATCLPGTITALRPFDPNEPASPENTLLIQHDIPTSRGTSGSAIFNAMGQVVAVNNAATVDESASNRFAVRADLVRLLLDDIDLGLVPSLTIVRSAPAAEPEPVAPTVCPTADYRNEAIGFGFDPPLAFDGPVTFADERVVPDRLLSLAFAFDAFLQIDVSVSTDSPSLSDWLAEWTRRRTDQGDTLVRTETVTMPSGVEATILTWHVPRTFGRLTAVELWAVRDDLRFGFSTVLSSADFAALGETILESFRSVCVD